MKIFKLLALSIILLTQNINLAVAKPSKDHKIRFIAVGDTGTGGDIQYAVAKAIKEKCAKDGCDFALILGDNIYNDGVKDVNDPQFISKFEKPYKDLDFKFYLTLGNHDYRGNVQAEIDYSKKSKKWVMPARVYNFSKGDIDFFSIDTNTPTTAQANRVSEDVSKSKAKWKVVFGHHPRYTNGVYKNATGNLAMLIDKATCNKADIYLCGHEHTKQHLKKVCNVDYLVVGTGAGLRKVGVASNSLFAKSSYGFSWFEVDEKNMRFQLLDDKGKVEYEYTRKK